MFGDPQGIEVLHHDEVFADVSAFESSGEEIGHEPADEVAAEADDFSNDEIFCFVKPRGKNPILFHQFEKIPAVIPFVVFHLLDDGSFLGLF